VDICTSSLSDRGSTEPSPERHDPHRTFASLATLGVPARVLETAPQCEWRTLQAELDRFYAFGYGGATQRAFLHSPHPKLAWDTPAMALRRHNGIPAVRAALDFTLRSLHSS
jgi:hypothetical protein